MKHLRFYKQSWLHKKPFSYPIMTKGWRNPWFYWCEILHAIHNQAVQFEHQSQTHYCPDSLLGRKPMPPSGLRHTSSCTPQTHSLRGSAFIPSDAFSIFGLCYQVITHHMVARCKRHQSSCLSKSMNWTWVPFQDTRTSDQLSRTKKDVGILSRYHTYYCKRFLYHIQ